MTEKPTALRLALEVQYRLFPPPSFTLQVAYKAAICKPLVNIFPIFFQICYLLKIII